MRVRSGLFAGLAASLLLLGACARDPMDGAYYDDAPPPPAPEAHEPIELAGGPSREAERAAGQAQDDAYIASLASKGLIAERRIDPETGEYVLVVSNRPIPNPVLFGGPEHRRPRLGQSGRKGGRMAPVQPRIARAPAASAAASAAASPAASASAAPAASAGEQAAPAAQPAPALSAPMPAAEPAAATEPKPRFRMTSTHWIVLGLALLALLGLIYAATRPKKRTRFSGRQAPSEASGGEAHA